MKEQFQFHGPVNLSLSSKSLTVVRGFVGCPTTASRSLAFRTVHLLLTPRNIPPEDRFGKACCGNIWRTDSMKVPHAKLTCKIYKLFQIIILFLFYLLRPATDLLSIFRGCRKCTVSHMLNDLNMKPESVGRLCFIFTFCTVSVGWSFVSELY